MTVLCLGALLAGMTVSSLIPFLPFACALLSAVVLGSAWAIAGGAALGPTVLSALSLLFACQIGYGLGILVAAFVGQSALSRRTGREKDASPPARPLRTGNGPR